MTLSIKTHVRDEFVDVTSEMRRIVLGIWQGIYFFEFNGPRSRKLIVQVVGI